MIATTTMIVDELTVSDGSDVNVLFMFHATVPAGFFYGGGALGVSLNLEHFHLI